MDKTSKLRIGNLTLENPFVLAPLAGITDAPMRRLCRSYGAALTYSEMVSGKGLHYRDKNTERLLAVFEDEKPVGFQLFGSETEIIRMAAEELADRDNAVFDINMGCPVPKVVKNGEGSALLKTSDKIYDIVCAAVKGTRDGAKKCGREPKPVTVKIRMGFDEAHINAVEVAKAIEAAEAAAVTVHGRTREQYYSGKANWEIIAQVKQAVNIPVIGNGDVFDGDAAMRMLRETGCDFVMIARGALGNPWIFKEAAALWRGEDKPFPPVSEEKVDVMIRHFESLLDFKGEYAAVREMRKHIGWYLKGMKGAASARREACNITKATELRIFFEKIKK